MKTKCLCAASQGAAWKCGFDLIVNSLTSSYDALLVLINGTEYGSTSTSRNPNADWSYHDLSELIIIYLVLAILIPQLI